MEAAAHAAITDGATPPFHLRSALIGEVVGLYDAVRRQRQDVASFERLVLEPLALEAESEGDAGAERMLRQTRFLAATFRGYEARRDALGACDEHTLARLADGDAAGAALPAGACRRCRPDPRRQRPVERRLRSARAAARCGSRRRSWPPRPCSPPAGSSACTTCCPALPRGQTPRGLSEGVRSRTGEFVERFDAPRLLVPAGPTPCRAQDGV